MSVVQNQLVNAKVVGSIPVLWTIHLRVGLNAPSNSEYSVHVLLFMHKKKDCSLDYGSLIPA